jgi:hypothetical protein
MGEQHYHVRLEPGELPSAHGPHQLQLTLSLPFLMVNALFRGSYTINQNKPNKPISLRHLATESRVWH